MIYALLSRESPFDVVYSFSPANQSHHSGQATSPYKEKQEN